ncbi:SET domain-containing protein [Coniochaeta sp. PMI_546]|nr:SET domain-containing protein [Coniochaeta sp. PMI_546]
MEKATERHFFQHAKLEPNSEERKRCHWCQIRSFATHKKLPVTIVNETEDGATLPPHFRFIDRSILTDGVSPAGEEFRSGCQCPDDEECMYSSCLCLEEMAPDSDADSGDEGGRDGRPRRKRFAYHSHGAKRGMLRSRILQSREPIYECHSGCSCSLRCPNRVVERGRQIPLQIFRTDERGWGVRCPVDLKKGQFVDKYLGEIITGEEADRRRAQSSMARRKDVYLFALDKFSDENSLDHRLAGPPLEVDGEFMSGPTRFINHSCDPNMRIFARVGDHADKHIHDLALFAIRDIAAGEELTFDYVDGLEELDSDAHDPAMNKDMTRCLCRSRKCRGWLW